MKGPELITKLKSKEKKDLASLKECEAHVSDCEATARARKSARQGFVDTFVARNKKNPSSIIYQKVAVYEKEHEEKLITITAEVSNLNKNIDTKNKSVTDQKVIVSDLDAAWEMHAIAAEKTWAATEGVSLLNNLQSFQSIGEMYAAKSETLSAVLQDFRTKISQTSWFRVVETSRLPWSGWMRNILGVDKNLSQMIEMEDKIIGLRDKEVDCLEEIKSLSLVVEQEKTAFAQKSDPRLSEGIKKAGQKLARLEDEVEALVSEVASKAEDMRTMSRDLVYRKEELVSHLIASRAGMTPPEKDNIARLEEEEDEAEGDLVSARHDLSQKESVAELSKTTRKKAENAGYGSSSYSFPAAVVLEDFSSIRSVADHDEPSHSSTSSSASSKSNDSDSFGGGSFGGGSFGGGRFSTGGGF